MNNEERLHIMLRSPYAQIFKFAAN